jgi:enterochelin esterase-like enzyme
MKKNLLLLIFTLVLNLGQAQTNDLTSKIILDSINSKHLNEYRKYCLYLPENFESFNNYPVVFATDGQMIIEDNYRLILDSLISNKIIEPIILIGIHSNETLVTKGVSFRQYEYIKGFNKKKSSKRYNNHNSFFVQEIRDSIKIKYKIEHNAINTTFYGCSNGGGYGISLFLQNNKSFNNYICCSPLGNIKVSKRKKDNTLKLYSSYGKKELFFLVDAYEKLVSDLTRKKYDFENIIFNGGHDRGAWKIEFTKGLIKINGIK